MSDKNSIQPSQSFTEKDIDNWFETLRGKTIEDTKSEIQKDATVLREILLHSKKEKSVKPKNTMGFMPYAALASFVMALFVLSMIIPTAYWWDDSSEEANGFAPNNIESQSDFIKAFNQPVYIENLDSFIKSMEKALADHIQFEKEPYYDKGIMIRILIKIEPNIKLAEQLEIYGFKPEVGEQYLYFTEKEQQD